jgi:RNA polymerase sigma factor (TIGR02999 family)
VSDTSQTANITVLLRRWQEGDSLAYDLVIDWAYQRMLAIAAGFVAHERMATEPAALVHEAYLRLRNLRRMEWRDRNHFFSVAAAELRRVLIDQARKRIAEKREGARRRIPVSEDLAWVDARGQDILDLDQALNELEAVDSEKVRLVELRYLMGCTVPEICELRGVSDATVERHLRFARSWLYGRLHEGGGKPALPAEGPPGLTPE